MLTLDDCIAFSGLTAEQIDSISRHEHLPPIIIAEWAEGALQTLDGCALVTAILAEEAEIALDHHLSCAPSCMKAWKEFERAHPLR
ncbi:MAG: hypothetical protein ACM31L_19805 [Actinomycetota bacterium]